MGKIIRILHISAMYLFLIIGLWQFLGIISPLIQSQTEVISKTQGEITFSTVWWIQAAVKACFGLLSIGLYYLLKNKLPSSSSFSKPKTGEKDQENTIIKTSLTIMMGCLFIWGLLVGGAFMLENGISATTANNEVATWRDKAIPVDKSTSTNNLIINLTLVTFGVCLISFLLSLLGGYILKKNTGAIRMAIVVSITFFFGSFIVLEPYNKSNHWQEFLAIGILPVALFWGLVWIISGFIKAK